MKKEYISPELEIINEETVGMLATSLPVTEEETDTQMSHEFFFFGFDE